MSLKRLRPPLSMPQTRLAAAACLEKLAAEDMERACLAASPYSAIQAIARNLSQDDAINGKAWVVQASPGQSAAQAHSLERAGLGNISAWPLWFRDGLGRVEMPLLYLLRSESVAGLRAAICEAADRGILCNDAEITSSRWPKSVHPAVPLWLASSLNGIPYDPASGQEALAILRSAMQAMYVDDEPGFFYMTLHDDNGKVPAPAQADVHDAYKGMYRLLAAPESRAPAVRLLGAGQALGKAVEAARLLREDWNIPGEVWSCPSYTRLAREGREVERWNMLNPLSKKKTSHIQACLGSGQSPVLAITGYGQHIADQIGGFICARFVAMGADSGRDANGFPSAQWIVAAALKALGDEHALPMRYAEEALRRYALA
ncbi:pyruvate dehydrogenase [Herbaspirillum sp. SJZ099]|uniref:transketolase-like TK C-terminal-containing protein n=1 Tax=Herbaspirillum sp. SJZ099 TaxID=2572916 RepID=UPI0011A0968A|nr:pyruvate dehydrogenase [Herbaspirillum sp. SJZ099]TWC62129.1 pyruvate dehydrogenase E1 component [Herbaspirillum sp. SJZ099]